MKTRMPPGPRMPKALQTALMIRWQNSFLKNCQRNYGDCFTVRIMGQAPLVYVVDPALVRTVFTGDMKVFHAGESNAMLGPILGQNSLLLLDEEEAMRTRAQAKPPFHGDSVRRQVETMSDIAVREVLTWPVGQTFPLMPRMQNITFEVILRTVMGVNENARLAEMHTAFRPLVDVDGVLLLGMIQQRLLKYRPWKDVMDARERARTLLLDQIARTKTDPDLADRPDVLAMLVRAGEMSDEQLSDQLITLLIAGHETTATALSWAFERLTRFPEVLARAAKAADEDDIQYLDALVMESLRARPVFPDVGRKLTRETKLGDWTLPAGTLVAPGINLMHNDGRHYENPTELRPERFAERGMLANTWIPFGGGTRRCLGATFASVEMRVVLREVLRRVEFATTTAPPEQAKVRHVTLVPHRGSRVTVVSRRAYSTESDTVSTGSPGA
ncbi:cytochrome P450 [Streptomyces clavifer]|uniref:cytochrome P450 n=1 Tax=Streptomyces clavifer TaxID=68188 RepID=UPI0036C85E14